MLSCTGKTVRKCKITRGPRKGETFTLHAGKSAKKKKQGRGRWLQRNYVCKRDRKTGQYVECRPTRR